MPKNIASEPVLVWTGQNQSCNYKRPQKTGLQWSSPVFCRFGENEAQTGLLITTHM